MAYHLATQLQGQSNLPSVQYPGSVGAISHTSTQLYQSSLGFLNLLGLFTVLFFNSLSFASSLKDSKISIRCVTIYDCIEVAYKELHY